LAVRPELAAGPKKDPLLKLASPVIESVVAALTTSVALLLRVSDEKAYDPPESVSVPPLTETLP
jgi:hypothetical protein